MGDAVGEPVGPPSRSATRMPRPFVPRYTRPYTRGSPVIASPMLPHWCALSLIRTQLAPALSERNTPVTPSTVPMRNSAGYVAPGAA